MTHQNYEEIKSEKKVWSVVSIKQFLVFVVLLGIILLIKNTIPQKLRIVYMIFSIPSILYIVMPSIYNPKRINGESIIILIKNKRNRYKPIL